MLDKIILLVLALATLAAVAAILGASLAQLRDELVKWGWITERSLLGRMSLRAQNARLARTLKLLGLPQEYLDAMKLTTRAAVPRVATKAHADTELSFRLLRNLKSSTRTLDTGFTYEETGEFYIDVMGDMYFRDEDNVAEYSLLLYEWQRLLESRSVLAPPDCLLGNKNGCVLLAQQLRSLLSPSMDLGLMVARMSADRSRVARTDPALPHRTDIEGLEAFLRLKADQIQTGRRFRVQFVDDSCTGARNLHDAVTTFNRLIAEEQLPFYPVTDAAVLFAIKSDKAEERCKEAGVTLHAVVALGKDEIKKLCGERDRYVHSHLAEFKRSFACRASRDANA